MRDDNSNKHRNRSTNSRSSSRAAGIVATSALLSLCCLSVVKNVNAYPIQYVVEYGRQKCLYDRLEEDEYLTMAIFINEGDSLEANVIMEGPVSVDKHDGAAELHTAIQQFERNKGAHSVSRQRNGVNSKGVLHISDHVSYDNDIPFDDDDDDIPEFEGDDDRKMQNHAEMVESINAEKMKIRDLKHEQQDRMDGVSYEKTFQIQNAGWYRVCAEATHSKITVELEMRKSSELGVPHEKEGHVPSMDAVIEYEEEMEIDADAAKEEDLEQSKEYLKQLHKMLGQITESQRKEAHRIHVFKELNAHSHSRMVLGSLFETILFICVTAFQVHTIRKWFSSDPMLGR